MLNKGLPDLEWLLKNVTALEPEDALTFFRLLDSVNRFAKDMRRKYDSYSPADIRKDWENVMKLFGSSNNDE